MMTRRVDTLSPDYFESIYRSDYDPWKFASSDYEHSKYETTVAALPRSRYTNAFEVGCSIGVLTSQLAPRCDRLLAVDAALAPLNQAMLRCAHMPWVRIEQMFVPQQWPEGTFDLVLLSEVVYYLSAIDVARLATKIIESTAAGSQILLVHWTELTDYPLSGDDSVQLFIESLGDQGVVERSERHQTFRLDLVVRL